MSLSLAQSSGGGGGPVAPLKLVLRGGPVTWTKYKYNKEMVNRNQKEISLPMIIYKTK